MLVHPPGTLLPQVLYYSSTAHVLSFPHEKQYKEKKITVKSDSTKITQQHKSTTDFHSFSVSQRKSSISAFILLLDNFQGSLPLNHTINFLNVMFRNPSVPINDRSLPVNTAVYPMMKHSQHVFPCTFHVVL